MEIEVQCPCPESPQSQQQTPQSCCEQTRQSLTSQIEILTTLHREMRFRNGQVNPNEREAYGQWLNQMRENVIQRNRYYPEYQSDWGTGGFIGASGSPLTGIAPAVFTVVKSHQSSFFKVQLFNLGPAGAMSLRVTVTDVNGAVGTVTLGGIGVGFFGVLTDLSGYGVSLMLANVDFLVGGGANNNYRLDYYIG